MKKQKIGIMTFHNADNLGAVLQAYALQRVLEESCAVSAEVIDYRCPAIEETKKAKYGSHLFSYLKALPKNVYYGIKHRGFEKFRRKFLNRSEKTYTELTIADSVPLYDAYITGSDQVWNPECSGWDDAYFLNFASDKQKKYSYAASLGTYHYKKDEYSRYQKLLERFDRISVRECSAVEELKKLGIDGVEVCPDPVFLLPAEYWRKIMSKRLCSKRYVLVYLVLPDVNVMNSAREYARKNNCKLICNKKSIEFILHNSPREFLSWVYYADCIFTNSFHGTVFSLLFNKPLAADIELLDSGINNRVEEILLSVGAKHCIIPGDAQPGNALEKIDLMRRNAINYLRKICEEV